MIVYRCDWCRRDVHGQNNLYVITIKRYDGENTSYSFQSDICFACRESIAQLRLEREKAKA